MSCAAVGFAKQVRCAQACGEGLLRSKFPFLVLLLGVCLVTTGCTTLGQWWHQGLKVGPNYVPPPAPIADTWVQAKECVPDRREDLCAWWSVFDDLTLEALIDQAYHQNLGLQAVAQRIEQAYHARSRTVGDLFPQSQVNAGGYLHGQLSENLQQGAFPQVFDVWYQGLAASWEVDLWGKYRRGLEAADAALDAADDHYKDVLVILLADVATNYVQLRAYQQRLVHAEQLVAIQRRNLEDVRRRFEAGKSPEMDLQQARINLAQAEAAIPPLVTGLWQANYQLCVLLGMPAQELLHQMDCGPIPAAPAEVVAGIPADLLRRRPDVRRAEREAAGQSAQIGVAEAEFYPAISVAGFLGYSADQFATLFDPRSFTGLILPRYSWKILNYGRLRADLRAAEAQFREKVLAYQQQVLRAGEEVESAMVAFLQAQVQVLALGESVQAAGRLVELVESQYKADTVPLSRLTHAEETLVRQQDRLAAAQQEVALHLIRVYRALGGGWEAFAPPAKPCTRTAPTQDVGERSSAAADDDSG